MDTPFTINELPIAGNRPRILQCEGSLDIGEACKLLRGNIFAHIKAKQVLIIVCLEKVVRIDSAGIAELLYLFLHLQKMEGMLALVGPDAGTMGLLKKTHLIKVFQVYPNRKAASEALMKSKRK